MYTKERGEGREAASLLASRRDASLHARRLPMHTHRKRRTGSVHTREDRGEKKKREAPPYRKWRLKADVRTRTRVSSRAASNCTLPLAIMLRGVAAENLPADPPPRCEITRLPFRGTFERYTARNGARLSACRPSMINQRTDCKRNEFEFSILGQSSVCRSPSSRGTIINLFQESNTLAGVIVIRVQA